MKGIIYKYTFPSGKIYIGQTYQLMEKRHAQHISEKLGKGNTAFWTEYAQNGKQCDYEIIKEIESDNKQDLVDKLNMLETYYINQYNSTNPKIGVNIRSIGTNGTRLETLKNEARGAIWMVYANKLYPFVMDIAIKIDTNHLEELTEEENKFMRNIRAYIDDEVKQQKWFVNNQDYILNNYRYAYWDIIDDYLDNNPSVFTKQKQFLKCNKEGIIVKTYDSIRKITDELNIKNGTLIYNCIKGKIKYAYGFIWKMKTSEIDAEKIANEILDFYGMRKDLPYLKPIDAGRKYWFLDNNFINY